MLIHGACHCGNIRFALTWLPAPVTIQARACGCSFFLSGVWTSCAGGALRVTVRDAALVQRYAFGTRTADFLICRACGVVPLVTSDIAGRRYAVVNVNTFEEFDRALLPPGTGELRGGAHRKERLARRQRHWIADIRFD